MVQLRAVERLCMPGPRWTTRRRLGTLVEVGSGENLKSGGTQARIVQRHYHEVAKILRLPEVKERNPIVIFVLRNHPQVAETN